MTASEPQTCEKMHTKLANGGLPMCLHFHLRPCREWETAQLDKYPWKRKSGGWIAGGALGCSGDCTAMDLTNRPVRVSLSCSADKRTSRLVLERQLYVTFEKN